MSKKWNDEKIREALSILGSNHDYSQAIEEIGESSDSLGSAFKRAGLEAPTTYLADNVEEAVLRRNTHVDSDVHTLVVANDFHVPWHSKNGVAAWLKFCKDLQPDVIVINGDFLDCHSISSFPKYPEHMLLQDEIDIGVEILEQLRRFCPLSEIWYTEGNHEERLKRLIKEHPGFYRLNALKLENLMGLDRLGIEYRGYKKPVQIRNVSVVHGDKVSKHSAYSAKATLIDNGYMNVIHGHTHRMGWYNHTGHMGRRRGYENGGLYDMSKVDYLVQPNWQTGFCVVFQRDDKPDYLQINPIEMDFDGSFVWQGKVYGKTTQTAQ